MMGGSKFQYFWQVAGFVTVIICMDGGPDPVNAFDTAILRAQETGLGILVYSLVAVLLWPSSSRADFYAAAGNLASTQHQLYQAYLRLMQGQGGAEKAQPLRAQEVQVQTRFGQLLDAAETEDYEVWELRRQWRQLSAPGSRPDRDHGALARELRRGAGPRSAASAARSGGLWRSRSSSGWHRSIACWPGMPRSRHRRPWTWRSTGMPINRLSHFHKAAVAVTRSRLQHLERLTRSLFEAVCDIKGFGEAVASTGVGNTPSTLFPAGSGSTWRTPSASWRSCGWPILP